MKKRFNTAGPCNEQLHYMVPAAPRLPQAPELVEHGGYFAVHAPRQTGKTTTLSAVARQLTAAGEYAALHFSCETGAPALDDYEAAQRAVIYAIREAAEFELEPELQPPMGPIEAPPENHLKWLLRRWARACPKPLALFFDEIDALRGESLVSVLRQLRAGFADRPVGAPWSVVLCGLSDVRDYKAASGGDASRLGTSSPFNIKIESLTVPTFDEAQLRALYGQHTQATGQVFSDEAISLAYALTRGQPWLVNSLAAEIVYKEKVTGTITADHVEIAKERLIVARATHLDSLVARLHEPPVRRLLEPVVASRSDDSMDRDAIYDDDYRYAIDLGLVASTPPVRPANPIYREVIVRALTANYEPRIVVQPQRFVSPDGRLDMAGVMEAFVEFWLEHGEAMARRGQTYPEATAQIVMMAYLQRVVNGGGFIDREYGIGRGRIDLLVRWPVRGAEPPVMQREAIELKRWADGDKKGDPLTDGLRQLDDYLARMRLESAWLVIFDQRACAADVVERTQFEDHTTPKGRPVRVVRA